MVKTGKTVQELVALAEESESNGGIVEALGYWRDVLDQDRDPILLCRFGRLATKAGWDEVAREAFSEALRLDPKLAYANQCMALWYDDHGEPEKAIYYFDRSLDEGESAPTYTLMGAVQLQIGRVEEARESFSKALSVDPRYEEAYYNLGGTLVHENPTEAIELLSKAVELDPQFALAHCELGWVLRRLERYPEAELHLRQAVELDDSDGLAHVYLGNLLWTLSDLDAAEKEFKKAVEVSPNESLPHWCLAHFYENQGRPREAEFYYEAAFGLDPDNPVANLRFGVFLKALGDYAKARVHLERAMTSDKTCKDAHTVLDEIE